MPHNASLRFFACQLVARIFREYLRASLDLLGRDRGGDGSFCPLVGAYPLDRWRRWMIVFFCHWFPCHIAILQRTGQGFNQVRRRLASDVHILKPDDGVLMSGWRSISGQAERVADC
jgi:hypothetical protein